LWLRFILFYQRFNFTCDNALLLWYLLIRNLLQILSSDAKNTLSKLHLFNTDINWKYFYGAANVVIGYYWSAIGWLGTWSLSVFVWFDSYFLLLWSFLDLDDTQPIGLYQCKIFSLFFFDLSHFLRYINWIGCIILICLETNNHNSILIQTKQEILSTKDKYFWNRKQFQRFQFILSFLHILLIIQDHFRLIWWTFLQKL